jgi:tRNA pseudouridine38-40 synthase
MTSPRTFKLVVEYDGTRFHGWQIQPDVRTVQGELARALQIVLGTRVVPAGAGRTDAGVHALGQVASFETSSPIEPDRLREALNALTGGDLVVKEASEGPEGFHARASAIERTYRYRLLDSPSALHRRTAWYPKRTLDVGSMERAATALAGTHAFDAFAAASDESPSKVCTVREATWTPWEAGPEFWISADRFLHRMVRTIVGTLVEIGAGTRAPSSISELLSGGDRRAAGRTAPPRGLTLVRVRYRDA